MRTLALTGHGDLSGLQLMDVAPPDIRSPRDVLVDLKAAALNHLDLWTVRGLPGLTLEMPHTLGGDGAGVVAACGDDVTEVQPGDRVLINPGLSCYDCEFCRAGEHSLCETYRLLGEHVAGTLAEQIVVPVHNVALVPDLPDGMKPLSWAEAAAFSLATLTAWRMLVTKARLRPGETVLIWGIGGGVALAALAVAKLHNARTIVTSSSDAKLSAARALGADFTLNHGTHNVAREVYSLTDKRGVDVVIDNVGEETWSASTRALAKRGRLVTCGGTTGPMVQTDVRRLFWNQHTIMGSTMGSNAEFRRIVDLLAQGHLRPVVDSTVALADAGSAFRRMESGAQFGKLVIEI